MSTPSIHGLFPGQPRIKVGGGKLASGELGSLPAVKVGRSPGYSQGSTWQERNPVTVHGPDASGIVGRWA